MSAAPDDGLRSKLAQVEDDLTQLRSERAEAVRKRDQAKGEFAKLEAYDANSDQFKSAMAATGQLGAIDDKIAEAQQVQVGVLKMLGQDREPARSADRGKAETNGREGTWDSSALFDSTVKSMLERAATTKGRFGGIELGQVADRDSFKADLSTTANMRTGDSLGTIEQLRRPLRLLDLLPVGSMDSNVLPYTVESGSFAGAAETVEGAVKPEIAITYTDASATAQTIAAWMKVRKQALADVSALRSIIDGRLRYSVQRRLEGQILSGTGVDPNLRGILNTTGIGAVTYDAGKLAADQVLAGITTVLLADAQASGIIVHPIDWQNLLTAKAAGDGHYYSGGPFSVTPQVLWGVPLIPSVAIPQGMLLVGDFALGAQLFIREGVNVLLSDSDQDDFIRNRVTLLGEMRAALAVFRPSAFATVDIAA
jgi:HK97 family phage major capsid protein